MVAMLPFAAIRTAANVEKARIVIIAPKVGGVTSSNGQKIGADFALSGAPSLHLL